MAKSDGCDYFRRSSLFWIITVTLSMGYFTCTIFIPEHVPYDNLGPLGSLSKYLVQNHHDLMVKGYWAAWAIHLFEALIAMRICRAKGISGATTRCLWFVQTVLFGFASLGLLIKYKPDRLKHQ